MIDSKNKDINVNRLIGAYMKRQDVIKCLCRNCADNRYHDVLFSYAEPINMEYRVAVSYSIVQCRGCKNVSFLRLIKDYEVMIPIDDDGNYEPETLQEIFPQTLEGYKEHDYIDLVPEIVRKVYNETVTSIKNRATIVSGIGLRAIIEAICNDIKISGSNLQIRINKMANLGYISKEDAKRLQGIRFLGNDAVHEIKPAKKDTIVIALKIIDHIIETLYTLKESSDYLELPLTEYIDVEKIALREAEKIPIGTQVTFSGLLGSNFRRVEEKEKIEAEFYTKVKANSIDLIHENVLIKDGKNVYERRGIL